MEERNSWFWEGKPWQAFKSFAIIFSFVINFVLILVLLLIAPLIFPVIVTNVAGPIVGGLSDSFVMMNSATISQTISLDTEMPLSTTIPISAITNVTLTQEVPLSVNTTFLLPGGGGSINGTVSLALPSGTSLPVELNMMVPVNQSVAVVMDVPVEIELQQTELGVPFQELQGLFLPLDELITNLPADNEEFIKRSTEAVLEPE
ncbi:MAG: hypothetical protein GY796_34780 [Chloroflexi bacterium]|nr:hypothetical protein [Chloroflexota bacterium]